MTHLDATARRAYARGEHPIDHAHMRLTAAFDLYAEEQVLPPRQMAGLMLAELLAAGWGPAGGITVPDFPTDDRES